MAYIKTTVRTATDYAYECANVYLDIPEEAVDMILKYWREKGNYAEGMFLARNQCADVEIWSDKNEDEPVGGIRGMVQSKTREDKVVTYKS